MKMIFMLQKEMIKISKKDIFFSGIFLLLENNYFEVIILNYYKIIKEELINNEVYKRVKDYSKNKSDLRTYYNVGKLLIDAQGGEKRAKYGDQLIKEYSAKLTEELGKNIIFLH